MPVNCATALSKAATAIAEASGERRWRMWQQQSVAAAAGISSRLVLSSLLSPQNCVCP